MPALLIEDVDDAALAGGERHQLGEMLRVGDVAGAELGRAACGDDRCADRFERRRPAAVENDVRALARQALGDRRADPLPRSGDDGVGAGKSSVARARHTEPARADPGAARARVY